MDPVFTATNAEIRLSFSAQETSSMLVDGDSDKELDDSGEEDSGKHTIETYEQNMAAVDDEHLDTTKENPFPQEAPEKGFIQKVHSSCTEGRGGPEKSEIKRTGGGVSSLSVRSTKKIFFHLTFLL